jgi:Tol biopolymer transport system component
LNRIEGTKMKKIKLLFLLIAAISLQGNAQQILIGGTPDDPVMNPIFSPDGNKIAYTQAGYKGILVYDINSKSSTQITDEDAAGFAFKWSSDSKSVLSRVAKYENNRRYNAVKVFDVDSKQSTQLTEYRTMMPFLPEWSDGDSKVILPTKTGVEIFNSGKQKRSTSLKPEINAFVKSDKIVTRNAVLETEKIIEPLRDAQIINLVTSPDKDKVLFEIMGGNMYSMKIDGTDLTDLGKGNRPRWSSDSKKIIYMVTEDDGHNYTASDIYIINDNGTQKKNITSTGDLIEMNPCFAPDGKSIVFDVANDGSIYLMNIE